MFDLAALSSIICYLCCRPDSPLTAHNRHARRTEQSREQRASPTVLLDFSQVFILRRHTPGQDT